MPTGYIKRVWKRFFKPLEIELVEACEAIPGLRKVGHNDELEFDYLRILELANALREELLPRGIVLIPHDLECIEQDILTNEGSTREARVKTEFTITDGYRRLVLCSYGSARDPNGFAVAIAQTMGLKALLKRLSLTYGEEDDPEVPRWARKSPETTHQRARQLEYQKRAWKDVIANSGMTLAEVDSLLQKAFGNSVTSEVIVTLPDEDFDKAMQLLLQHSDLTELISKSTEQAKKPQPVVSILDGKVKDEIAI